MALFGALPDTLLLSAICNLLRKFTTNFFAYIKCWESCSAEASNSCILSTNSISWYSYLLGDLHTMVYSCNTVSKILLAKQIESCDILWVWDWNCWVQPPKRRFPPSLPRPECSVAAWWGGEVVRLGPAESWEVADYLKYQISDIEAAALSSVSSVSSVPLQSNYCVLPGQARAAAASSIDIASPR